MTQLIDTEAPFTSLYASAPQTLPFARSLEVRAFLLERGRGNVLVYSTGTLDADLAAFDARGGATRHYLNHWHEAMFASPAIGAPLFCHTAERASVEKAYRVRGTFSRRHVLDEDFEAIPIPGHTPGATAYLWDAGGRRFLFTGDSIYVRHGEWVAAVLDSSDRESYMESLAHVRELDFDVLVPWAATRGDPWYALTDRADTRRRIDALRERLWRGEDH